MNTSNTDGMPKSQRFQMDLISNLLEKIPGIVRLNFLDRRRFSRANQANRPRNLETVIAFWRFREKTNADRASVLTTADMNLGKVKVSGIYQEIPFHRHN